MKNWINNINVNIDKNSRKYVNLYFLLYNIT